MVTRGGNTIRKVIIISNPAQSLQQQILQIPPADKYRRNIHRTSVNAINYAPWRQDQFAVLDNAVLMKFRHDPAFIGKIVQGRGAFTNPGKNRQGRIDTVIGDKVNNTLKISLRGSRPGNPERMFRRHAACSLRTAKRASIREKTSS